MSAPAFGRDALDRVGQILDRYALPIASGVVGLAAGPWIVIQTGEWLLPDVAWRAAFLEHDAWQRAIRCLVGVLFFAIGWRFR